MKIMLGLLLSSKPQVIRTAKAERRSQGQLVPPPGEKESLSPAEERALQAEKRSAWRQARYAESLVTLPVNQV